MNSLLCPVLLMISFCCLVGYAVPERPNIVWFTSEDNSANWYRLYNPEHGAPMPHVEKLAEQGLVFNNAYSSGAVCSVARSVIISGCHAVRIGTQYHRNQVPAKMPEGLKMFPYYLRQAGYYTTNNYKEDYNFSKQEKRGVWDESSQKATYRKRKANQPFFHVQNTNITHESKLFGKLSKGRKTVIDPSQVKLFPYHPDTPLFRQKYAQYLSLNTEMDSALGKTIQQLEQDGLMDDTFIFHYGDHGGVLPGSKGYARNDGLQVAMVVYVPKNWQHLVPAQPGSRIDGFVEFVDLAATVLNLAGIEIPSQIDGVPFLGEGVTLQELNQRDTALGYAERFGEKYDMVRFLRKGKYTYWRSYQPFNYDGLHNGYRYRQAAYVQWRELAKKGSLNAKQAAFYQFRQPEQLYDIEKDPHEVHNLAADPAYQDILLELRGSLQRKLISLPDIGFFPESVFLAQSKGDGEYFGRKHKEQIAKFIAIADLQLLPFAEAKPKIAEALASAEPIERYWGLITCSAFGQEAAGFVDKITKLAESDSHNLVRMRAAEFLGLTQALDPMPYIYKTLEGNSDPIEVNLILNTVTLLKGRLDGKIDLMPLKKYVKLGKGTSLIRARMNYLLNQ